jgi:GGDEF domain-containing protein
MSKFAARPFRRPEAEAELTRHVRIALPVRFEAVAEAIAAESDVTDPCAVVGRDVAQDGTALGEALESLRSTYEMVLGSPPPFEATEALSVAWSDATLEYLHDLSCEDPLTGLASLSHIRTRLAEIYRESELTDAVVSTSHALVIVELSFGQPTEGAGHHFTRALRLAQVAEALRGVYSGGQTLGRLGLDRAVAVVPRSVDLGLTVATLREFLADLDLGRTDVRVWIEGLPAAASSATLLLDDLAR